MMPCILSHLSPHSSLLHLVLESAGITDPQIDAWYDSGMAHGALGGKLLGAGNGGFMMFYAPKERHAQIKAALSDLEPVKFRFDRTGAQIVFYQPPL